MYRKRSFETRVLTRFVQKYASRVAHFELGGVNLGFAVEDDVLSSAEHTHEGDWVGEIQSIVKVKPREPSRPVRKRVTAASVAARFPPGPSMPSLAVPTQSASALNASPKLSVPPSPSSSPRVPAAAIAIDRPLSRAAAPSGVRLSAPLP